MKALHWILQGKGGCGKTFISAMLAQYLLEHKIPIACIDTDPVNSTFRSYKKLSVTHEEIINEKNEIDTLKIKKFVKSLIKTMNDFEGENFQCVIDNGATSFLPITNYLKRAKAFSHYTKAGNAVFVHTALAGGGHLKDTLHGLNTIFESFESDCKVIVWENLKEGEISVNGKNWEETDLYFNNIDKIQGIIKIPLFLETENIELQKMIGTNRLFSEMKKVADSGKDPTFSEWEWDELQNVKEEIFEQIDLVARAFV